MFDLNRIFIAIFFLLLLNLSSSSQVVYRGHDLNQVVLTFDDGPSPKYTEKVLDILKREKIKAAFFVVGKKAAKYPELIKKIAEGGHEIGNHTYYHSRFGKTSKEKFLKELNDTSDLIVKYSGKKPVYFRPVGGKLSKEEQKLIEDAGYKIVLWYGNADDFFHAGWGMRSPKSITKRILSQLKGGNIILMHDDSRQIIEALPEIIKEIRKHGYSFVTLSKLASDKH